MEAAHSILLNEEALSRVANDKRTTFVLEWICFLDKALSDPNQKDLVKEHQKKLVEQLMSQIQNSPGPPVRQFLARSLACLFSVGDPFLLFDSVNKCTDMLKVRDDSPSYLPTRLAAITCIGVMYQRLGRLMGRSYEETVSLLLKSMKSAESQTRCEIYLTMERVAAGMGAAAASVHRDIFKSIRYGLTDRVMAVRVAAAGCLQELTKHAAFLFTTDLESVFSLCFRAFEGSNYDVRCAVAQVLASLVAATQKPQSPTHGKSSRQVTLDEVLNLLAAGFLKGGIGFLKTSSASEMIKGSAVSRETRLGVTHSYALLAVFLGTIWLEKNLSLLLNHLLELLIHPKAASSHVESVFSRRCVCFIITSLVGKQLSEKSQAQAVREVGHIVSRHVSTSSAAPDATDREAGDTHVNQHLIICAMDVIGVLVEGSGPAACTLLNDQQVRVVDTIFSVLTHPTAAARFAAAWSSRCIAIACPSHLTLLIERCVDLLEATNNSGLAISGYSAALSALLGAAHQTPLGIPHNKGKLVFNIAEEMLRSTTHNSRLSLQRIQAGWLMVGSVITLSNSVVRSLLPRLLLLWKNSFPRTAKDLESEKARGDAFTWQVTLENRAGALSAMTSLLTHCKVLVTDEIVARLLTPVEYAISMLVSLVSVFKNLGPTVKASVVTTRLRLFEVLLLLPAEQYEKMFPSLLRLLVAELTLSESAANTTTSLLRTFSSSDDDIVLGSWIQRTDHRSIEDQIQPNTIGSGSLEHDVSSIYKVPAKENFGPFPLGVSVIDKSCLLFGHIFRAVAVKHRIQMLNHFTDCLKHAKSARQEAMQMNILCVLLATLRNLVDVKSALANSEVRNLFLSLIFDILSHTNPVLRSAAAQALGRVGQVVGEGRAVSEIAQTCFDRLKASKDAASRTGYALALGCLHRHVGSLGSNQHLNATIGILLTLSHDVASPMTQVWSLHSMTLVADAGGPMFRPYVEPALTQSLRLLMSVPRSHCDVHQCIGKLLAAVIIAVGPELQSDAEDIRATRGSLLLACSVMQEHRDPLVRTQAIACLQQLHMFAPQYLNLSSVVPGLCDALDSEHMFLRQAAISCLHQLSQIEALEVHLLGMNWLKNRACPSSRLRVILQGEHGLPGLLFCLLDTDSDERMVNDVKKILISFVHSFAPENLNAWISLCKEVLTAADSNSPITSPDRDFDTDDNEFSDDVQFKAQGEQSINSFGPPKWRTRVFAADLLRRIIAACETSANSEAHFDLSLARQESASSKKDGCFLVLHLSDLIRMAFMAATSDSDSLRLSGLLTLQLVIDKFSKIPEPEFPDHVILEQFQAQVGAALRPAFSSDTPSHVTATACQVCSAWIGSGVARDLNDLRRVHQLLVSSLAKLHKNTSCGNYNESAGTMEKLAILKAWAEVYVVAMIEEEVTKKRKLVRQASRHESDDDEEDFLGPQESLLQLVSPELENLSTHWLATLRDHALLTLPPEYNSQLPRDGGAFYSSETIDLVRPMYRNSWPSILHAAALWLCSTDFQKVSQDREKDFHLLFGICMEGLCSPRSTDPLSHVIVCLESLKTFFAHELPKSIISGDKKMSIELCHVLHRLLLTRESLVCQRLVLEIALAVLVSHLESLKHHAEKNGHCKPAEADVIASDDSDKNTTNSNEKVESGALDLDESISFALLEVSLCVLVRHLPQLSPSMNQESPDQPVRNAKQERKLTEESAQLVCLVIEILSRIPELCSPENAVQILPTVLFLITGVFRETAASQFTNGLLAESIVKCYERLCDGPFSKDQVHGKEWTRLLRGSLAMILDFSKSSDTQSKPSSEMTVRVVCTLISKSPADLGRSPQLQFPCINLLTQQLQSDNAALHCIRCLGDVFTHKDITVTTPYIHALAPRVFHLLTQISDSTASSQTPITKPVADVVLQSLELVQLLVDLAESPRKIELLSLYIPILISFLTGDSEFLHDRSPRNVLHANALQRLLVIGPAYPNEFRTIVGQVPRFKLKLETAIRNQQKQNKSSKTPGTANPTPVTTEPVPTIQLKTDFSNFATSS